ncbi:leucine-rich repeat receptor-like serine/threonine-protein kinase BAM3 [Cucurbita maxima]|uniref:Leucine-rich repeat receptor-like serine/threonine-protein kinase BAM3 n=1 Tax=Cucurbita maxima TaxID=3661 RepID=A0A6J1JA80_CUCMA|nr:leucine-rich repeat receptor-like serine/threonine-protein kinase BAM3 [Cucurbita maxima]
MASLLLPLFPLLMALLLPLQAKTHWEDTQVLKQLKNALDPTSIPSGSCLESWDFSLDPCDNLFGHKFTCGFRCDDVVSGVSRVTDLTLDHAGYSASLSSVFWNLPFLQSLDFSNNFFSGPIPNSFSNLTRLRSLSLSSNSFSGEVPPSIGSLSALEELYLNGNGFNGSIPASFVGLVSLKRLELQSNGFTGAFPDLGVLKNLYYLDGTDNGFSGELPAGFPASLVQLLMRNNSFEGVVPSSIGDLGNLQVVDLSHNQFSGSVPAALFEHPSLEQLTLSFNQFSAVETPNSSGARSSLIAVDLSDNEITGFLPPFLALMPKLSALSLENNNFTGMIPVLYAFKTAKPEPGMSPLVRLLLGGNYLFGPIPEPLRLMKPDSATVTLAGNCLFRCPTFLFFCQGGEQKSSAECRSAGPVIP